MNAPAHIPKDAEAIRDLAWWAAERDRQGTDVRETEWERVFGRCHAISSTGTYLMMERLNNLPEDIRKKLPKLPDWVRDARANNFGMNREGEIKVRDYANIDFRSALLREEEPL